MITRIFIDNYRCFTNFEFVPERLNFLMGANASGKSSFFDLMEALARLIVRGADVNEVFPTTSLTRWDSRNTQRIEVETDVQGAQYRYVLVVEHDREHERAVILSEEVTREGKTLFAFDRGNVRLHDNGSTKGAEFHIRGDKSFIAQIEDRPATKDLLVWRQFIEKTWTVRLNSHGQFLLASQNPEVVDYMAASHPFLFERPDGGPARVRPAIFDHESGLSASSQLARGLDHGR